MEEYAGTMPAFVLTAGKVQTVNSVVAKLGESNCCFSKKFSGLPTKRYQWMAI